MKRAVKSSAAMIVILAVTVVMLVAGCGKKGDPAPRFLERQAATRNLQVVAAGDGVMLSWTMDGVARAGRHIRN